MAGFDDFEKMVKSVAPSTAAEKNGNEIKNGSENETGIETEKKNALGEQSKISKGKNSLTDEQKELLMKLRFARFKEVNGKPELVTSDERRKICDENNIPYTLVDLDEKRPQRWKDEQCSNYLFSLLAEPGYIVDERKINKNITVCLKSLVSSDNAAINKAMEEYTSAEENKNITKQHYDDQMIIASLAAYVVSINDKKLPEKYTDKVVYFSKVAVPLINIIWNEVKEFNLDIYNLLNEGDVEKK